MIGNSLSCLPQWKELSFVMPAWGIYEISAYSWTYGMSYMYEIIIITKILIQFL